MPTVLIATKREVAVTEPHVKLLQENGFDVRLVNDERFALGLTSDEEVIDVLQGASATIAAGTRYTARVLENLPDLRVIARSGVGFDRVDIAAATANGVVVTITPNSNHEAVAEHAMALILSLAKSLVSADKTMRAGKWHTVVQRPIRGSTLGIVGLGRIGKSLAIRAQGMNMRVIATESMPDEAFVEKHGIELMGLDDLLGRADYGSLHCPLTDESRGMINHDTLALMKRGSSLVNTARGGLVVEADLVDALRTGPIASAGLDVFEQEPTARDNPLYALDNVILSPHVAGVDDTSVKDMGIEAANCIMALYQGGWPDGAAVNQELKGRWRW